MAKTKGTNPYSGSLGEPRHSGRNQMKPVVRVNPRRRQYQKGSTRTLQNYSHAWTLRLRSRTSTRNCLAEIVLLPLSTIKQWLATVPPTQMLRLSSSSRIRNHPEKIPLVQACRHWSELLRQLVKLLSLIDATPSSLIALHSIALPRKS